MHTQRLVSCGLLAAAIAAAPIVTLAAPKAAQPLPSRTPDQLVRDAIFLYAKNGSTDRNTRQGTSPQSPTVIQMRAATAEKRWSRMPAGAISDELTPLLAKLQPDSTFHAAVAYALAYNGVDIPQNADRVMLSEWPPDGPSPARYWRPVVSKLDVFNDPILYLALANLYRHTKQPAVLDTLMKPGGLDGEAVGAYSGAMLRLTREFPQAVIARAGRSAKATQALVDALSFFDFLKRDRNSVRPALKRMAAATDKAMARTARLCLEAMNKTGRRQ